MFDALGHICNKVFDMHLNKLRLRMYENVPHLFADDLLSALWFAAAKMANDDHLGLCEECGFPFISRSNSKSSHNEQRFCSSKYKMRDYRRTKKGISDS